MPFIPHTDAEAKAMLESIGADSIDDLFDEIPQDLKNHDLSKIPDALSEMELERFLEKRLQSDTSMLNFIGAGAYEHHIPAAVWSITSRGEWLTAYTPYQAEASQGSLQCLFEYQTMMASLMGHDVSNASLYDGASSVAEAILMAARLQPKHKNQIVFIPKTLHPHYQQTLKGIIQHEGLEFVEIPYNSQTGKIDQATLEQKLNDAGGVNIVVIPQPNFFGLLEEAGTITDWAHEKGALVIGVVNPLAMSALIPPGQWGEKGANIACGEGQPLGVPLAGGGPYFGFMTCQRAHVRQLPGRIVGRSEDNQGREAYTLTLQAREQHIRRAKATSNICTNQGLLVTAATIYMSLMGAQGLKQVALKSYEQTVYFKLQVTTIPSVNIKFEQDHFHECVIELPVPAKTVVESMAEQGLLAGYDLGQAYPELNYCLLVCLTETKTQADILHYCQTLASSLEELKLSSTIKQDKAEALA